MLIKQPNEDYDVFNNEIETQLQYTIQIKFKISHRNTRIILDFKDLKDYQGTPIANNEQIYNIAVPAQLKTIAGEQDLIDINFILIIIYLSIYLAIFIIASFLRTQKRMFFIIVYQLQSINLLILLNFQFPKPVLETLKALDIVNLKTIPVVGLQIDATSDGFNIGYFGHRIKDQLPQNNLYLVADYSFSFLGNGGMQIFMYIIAFWILWLITFIINTIYILKSKTDINIYFLDKIQQIQIIRTIYELIRDLLIRVHEILFYPICLMFFLQMWGANFDDNFNIASFTMAIIVFVYYLVFLRSVYNVVKPSSEDTQKKDEGSKQEQQSQKQATLFLDFKQQDQLNRNFIFFQYTIKVFYVAALVLLNDYQFAQFSIAMFVQVIYFFVLIVKRPYLRNILNSVFILGQLIFLGFMIIIITEQFKYREFEEDQKISDKYITDFYNYGFAFVIMLQILLGMYALMFVFNKAQDYYQFLKSRPQWGSSVLNKLEDLVFSDKSAQLDQGQDNPHIQLRRPEEMEMHQF